MATQAYVAAGIVTVEVTDDPIEPGRTYTDKATGMQKPLPARQTAFVWTGKRYPVEMKLDVPNTGPYRPGLYLIAGDVFAAGKYGRVEFNDRGLQLVSVTDAIVAFGGEAPKLKAA